MKFARKFEVYLVVDCEKKVDRKKAVQAIDSIIIQELTNLLVSYGNSIALSQSEYDALKAIMGDFRLKLYSPDEFLGVLQDPATSGKMRLSGM